MLQTGNLEQGNLGQGNLGQECPELSESVFTEVDQIYGGATRASLVRKIRMFNSGENSAPESRSRRFVKRTEQTETVVDFNAISSTPNWALKQNFNEQSLCWAAGLIYYLPVIERALNGACLRALAEAAGEGLLDKVLDIDLPDTVSRAPSNGDVPDSDVIFGRGQQLLKTVETLAAAPCESHHGTRKNAIAICDIAHRLISQEDVL